MQSSTPEPKKKGKSKHIKYKILLALFIALVLLLTGFYFYYFYPEVIPGMASIKQLVGEDINVLVFGFDDLESNAGRADADLLLLGKLSKTGDRLELVNILPENKISLSADFKEEELKTVITEVETLTGFKVDYHFSISYNGFTSLVNDLGGINIQLDEKLRVPELGLYLKKGENLLDGKETLNYSRWYDYRKDETDRTSRQQQVINALVEKAFKDKTIMDLPQLFKTLVDAYQMVETDIPLKLITEMAGNINKQQDIDLSYDVVTIDNTPNNIDREEDITVNDNAEI